RRARHTALLWARLPGSRCGQRSGLPWAAGGLICPPMTSTMIWPMIWPSVMIPFPGERSCQIVLARLSWPDCLGQIVVARGSWPEGLGRQWRGAGEGERAWPTLQAASGHFMVGMTNSAPSLTPEGQREVTVLVLV